MNVAYFQSALRQLRAADSHLASGRGLVLVLEARDSCIHINWACHLASFPLEFTNPSSVPANIGYMSGALKHFFDGIYYPCLEATRRRPYGLYVHGASDTGGAVRAVESIA